MPYITNNKISKSPIPNSVEVSDAEYSQALITLTEGGYVYLHNDVVIHTFKPEQQTGHKAPVWDEVNGDWYHEPLPEPVEEGEE